ncbi:MAG: insulinase family protein [Nitrospirae bacterium]|nr:insulinase family protein [Candidatus Troglogloeales bacterium]
MSNCRSAFLLPICLLLFSIPFVHAESKGGTPPAVSRTVLKNGLSVILVEENKAPVVTFQVWYKVGSRNERIGKTGLSHLLEHMMFKGTSLHGKGEFSRIVAKNGGTENAFTGNDYTAYFENFAANQIDLSLELESDRMQNLLIDPTEFGLEMEVVKEERRSRTDDDPYSSLVETLYATAFLVHPYHNPIIGWMDDINDLSRDDAYQHYKQYYQPNNATVVIAGDFKSETLLPKVVALFEKIPQGVNPNPKMPIEPPQRGERRAIVKREAQLPYIFMGFHTPNYKNPDTYPLSVLAGILSSGKSSRLYKALVYQQQLALDAGGQYEDLTTDPDLFYFYGTPRPGVSLEAVEAALNAEIKRLQADKVTDTELTKVQNQIEASFVFGADSNFARAMQIGRAETVGAGYDYVTHYVENIRKVTADDIQRVAQEYLIEDQKSVGMLIPKPKKEF